jgi:hypothetical protein
LPELLQHLLQAPLHRLLLPQHLLQKAEEKNS